MGSCFPCFKSSTSDYTTPDMEIRRKQLAEAAERRIKEQEGRGIKDPERLKRQQQRMDELERKQTTAGQSEGGLRWQVS